MIINTGFYFGENMVKYKHFESINSTSTYLKDNYQTLDNMFFVSSSFQSAGHGRKGRKWLSKSGEDLLFSVLIKDKEIIKDFAYISLFSAFSGLNSSTFLVIVLNGTGIQRWNVAGHPGND